MKLLIGTLTLLLTCSAMATNASNAEHALWNYRFNESATAYELSEILQTSMSSREGFSHCKRIDSVMTRKQQPIVGVRVRYQTMQDSKPVWVLRTALMGALDLKVLTGTTRIIPDNGTKAKWLSDGTLNVNGTLFLEKNDACEDGTSNRDFLTNSIVGMGTDKSGYIFSHRCNSYMQESARAEMRRWNDYLVIRHSFTNSTEVEFTVCQQEAGQ